LLCKIVGTNTLLFDNLASCNAYRKHARDHNHSHGILICLEEGTKIASDGILGGSSESADASARANQSRGKPPLSFVFGSLPAGETADGRLLETACDTTFSCSKCLEEHERAAAELEATETEVNTKPDELDDEIKELEQQLRKLDRDDGDEDYGGDNNRGKKKISKGGKKKKARR
jgi:hypothetical protein